MKQTVLTTIKNRLGTKLRSGNIHTEMNWVHEKSELNYQFK